MTSYLHYKRVLQAASWQIDCIGVCPGEADGGHNVAVEVGKRGQVLIVY